MRILKWQGKVSFEDSVAGGENPFCYMLHIRTSLYARIHVERRSHRRYMLQPKDLKTGRMYYGSVPFPQINSGRNGQKPSKRSKNTSKRGGVPKTPFLPQF